MGARCQDFLVALPERSQVPSAQKNAIEKGVPALISKRTGPRYESNLIWKFDEPWTEGWQGKTTASDVTMLFDLSTQVFCSCNRPCALCNSFSVFQWRHWSHNMILMNIHGFRTLTLSVGIYSSFVLIVLLTYTAFDLNHKNDARSFEILHNSINCIPTPIIWHRNAVFQGSF